jgi:hypothetical protein
METLINFFFSREKFIDIFKFLLKKKFSSLKNIFLNIKNPLLMLMALFMFAKW